MLVPRRAWKIVDGTYRTVWGPDARTPRALTYRPGTTVRDDEGDGIYVTQSVADLAFYLETAHHKPNPRPFRILLLEFDDDDVLGHDGREGIRLRCCSVVAEMDDAHAQHARVPPHLAALRATVAPFNLPLVFEKLRPPLPEPPRRVRGEAELADAHASMAAYRAELGRQGGR